MSSLVDTKKLTSDVVILNMKRQKLLPVPGAFRTRLHVNGKRCNGACALGAIYGASGPPEPTWYNLGLMYGFDGRSPNCNIYSEFNRSLYLEGYCDGVNIHLDALRAFNFLKD